jgi:hypothetical protein
MVTTREQETRDENARHPQSEEKEEEPSSPPRKKRSEKKPTAKEARNQSLVNALLELSSAAFGAQKVDAKNRFKGVALRRAALAISELDQVVSGGDRLAKGPEKVAGIGKGTAAYIDEFLETGDIYDIERYKEEAATGAAVTPSPAKRETGSKRKRGTKQDEEEKPKQLPEKKTKTKAAKKTQKPVEEVTEVNINRAPVLTLWVMIVAEKLGFNSDEASTYGKWVAGVLAQSKGRSLGIYEKKELSEEERAAKKRRDEELGVHHVDAFANMRIPVVDVDGNRLAVSEGRPISPVASKAYIERAFGENLDTVKAAMMHLAESMAPEELRKQAYHLYEQLRPDWKGWGVKGVLRLDTIRELAEKADLVIEK